MPALSYGLNLGKKPDPKTSLVSGSNKRKAVFDVSEDDEDGGKETADIENVLNVDTLSQASRRGIPTKLSNKVASRTIMPIASTGPQGSRTANLAAAYTSKKRLAAAQSLDPNIYDYDSIYDAFHTKRKNTDHQQKGPKYMQNLLAAAEVRKRDQLRAKEKSLAREREAEGDEFIEKEKFVTTAYKAQQEELRALEVAEAKNEEAEEERKKRQGGGMVGLYKGLLDKREEMHARKVQALEDQESRKDEQAEEVTPVEDDGKAEIYRAKASGAAINEEGQIVDKRQLLRAGLNVLPKPKTWVDASQTSGSRPVQHGLGSHGSTTSATNARQAQRERQSRLLEKQLEDKVKEDAEADKIRIDATKEQIRSKKNATDISSAKERYLQRQKGRAESNIQATS
ncbi:hypothetical protein MMC25_008308 [Agyrium rufum]|nr:hypothetical protein [Agyrium rufum]